MTESGRPILRRGDPVAVNFSKWDGTEHWRSRGTLLGADAYGTWLAIPTGTTETRPGARFAHDRPGVRLIPDAGYVATFYAVAPDPTRLHTYVDISSVPSWSVVDGVTVVSAIDLDLDVVRLHTGRIYVDDEDEFAEHQVTMSYPRDVVKQATDTCAAVLADVTNCAAPFNSVAQQWLSQV